MTVLSIIIPMYNAENFIEETINSILKQPCDDYEIIVVDDGSTDKSFKIVQQMAILEHKISLFHKENSGVSLSRNYGILKSKGKYILFIDADDVLCKDVYTKELCEKLIHNEYDAYKFGYILSDATLQKGNLISFEEAKIDNTHKEYNSFFRDHISSYLFKRDTLLKTHLFPAKVNLGEDVIFTFDFSNVSDNLYILNQHLFAHRSNPYSTVHTLNLYTNKWKEIEAWNRFKEQSTSKKEQEKCDTSIFWYLVKVIQYGCGAGIPPKKIIEDIQNRSWLQPILNTLDTLPLNQKDVDFYIRFQKSPYSSWIVVFLTTIPFRIMKRIKKTIIGQNLDKFIRYKTNIENRL